MPVREKTPKLNQEQINEIYQQVKQNEPLFRNILVELSEFNSLEDIPYIKEDAEFLKYGSLDEVFEKYVASNEVKMQIRTFQIGPFTSPQLSDKRFRDIDTTNLPYDNATVLIQSGRFSWLKVYQMMDDSKVEPIKTDDFYQH